MCREPLIKFAEFGHKVIFQQYRGYFCSNLFVHVLQIVVCFWKLSLSYLIIKNIHKYNKSIKYVSVKYNTIIGIILKWQFEWIYNRRCIRVPNNMPFGFSWFFSICLTLKITFRLIIYKANWTLELTDTLITLRRQALKMTLITANCHAVGCS